MELKPYQQSVVDDFGLFCSTLHESDSAEEAYNRFWTQKGYVIGKDGIKEFSDNLTNSVRICAKVPTAGGKTFIAVSSIRRFFDVFPRKRKAVVWLAPSDAILTQTLDNLRNPDHPYRQRLNVDFSGRVEVYNVEELLSGRNFSPFSIEDQLSIFVLSYDVLRAKKKDSRRMYRTNSVMQTFELGERYTESPIANADTDSVMVGLYDLAPLVILDESHNAGSPLSREMLENLHPTMVLELTATPLKTSNIFSFVSAGQLKKEHMVKIPALLYRREDSADVITTARDIRDELERMAIKNEADAGVYIRPIVLFQAQPKTKEDAQTYDYIRKVLVEKYLIPEEQVAIKTSTVNDLRNVDLLSRDCEIRYIITVNALKEGWDCPFAYILASLANKNSRTDVEQIIGRILRQPFATRSTYSPLNTSYILTCSNDFSETVRSVGQALVMEGFSEKDARIVRATYTNLDDYGLTGSGNDGPQSPGSQGPHAQNDNAETGAEDTQNGGMGHIEPLNPVPVSPGPKPTVQEVFEKAEAEDKHAVEDPEEDTVPPTDFFGKSVKKAVIRPEFKPELSELRVPRFQISMRGGFDEVDVNVLMTFGRLMDGFRLSAYDPNISFNTVGTEIGYIDVDRDREDILNFRPMERRDRELFNRTFRSVTDIDDPAVSEFVRQVVRQINDDAVSDKQLARFVEDAISIKDLDTINYLRKNIGSTAKQIQNAVRGFKEQHRRKAFYDLKNLGKINCGIDDEPFIFKRSFDTCRADMPFANSLYTYEERVDGFEADVRTAIAGSANVRWWHRIRPNDPDEFHLNGFLNHYPDFVLMTKTGRLVFIESKGQHLDGDDSGRKSDMGEIWDNLTGPDFRYFMVFKSKDSRVEKSISLPELTDILEQL
ncbi:MAG: DEAD/DEAH box helicase family protein [Candidatus Methanomethylophilaceae archaeon]|nr:DEAD/DEAH box helicase family protein [Candidatus Methanomethylophilaceae archaeon]MBR6205207.1 DEAD/DEAH box helicase family protein [Candidatus Methanomethylophilaceae archaeon]